MDTTPTELRTTDLQKSPPDTGQWKQFDRRTVMSTLLVALLITFVATLDGTVVAPAFPRMLADLQGFNLIVWIETVYLLTSTITLPIYGGLSDRVGRKPVVLGSLLIFLGASALCGFAQSMPQLVIFRAIQGIGAGGLELMASTMIADIFPPRERGKWQGLWGSVYALAALIGPLIGGLLTDHLSWRWVFFVNVPIGIAGLALLLLFVPNLGIKNRHASFDYLGSCLFILGSVFLLLGFSWGGSQFTWLSPQILILLGCAAVALIGLVVHCVRKERRGGSPVIEMSLFTSSIRIFVVALLVTTTSYIALVGSSYFIPIFIQGIIGLSATGSGAVLIPTMLTAIIGSMGAGFLISTTGRYKWIALLGAGLSILGTILLVQLDSGSSYLDVIAGTVVQGLGIGVGMSVYTIAVQNALPRKIGQVTSLMMYSRQIGQSIGLAVMGSVVSMSYMPAFSRALPSSLASAISPQLRASFANPLVLLSSPETQARLHASIAHASPHGNALFQALFQAARAGLTESIHNAFVLSLIIIVPTFLIVCVLQEIPLKSRAHQARKEVLAEKGDSHS